MTAFATIRPDAWNLPLFLHVLGAMVMVGSLALAAAYLFAARRDGSLESMRVGFRSLLFAALPAFIVMRVGAQWIADKENISNSNEAWVGIGFMSSDLGALLIVIATVAAGLAVRRAGRERAGGRGVAVAAWLVAVLIALYVVAIWAMATKPS
jgi:cytochrome bd-type quinol oxidase subunit 2